MKAMSCGHLLADRRFSHGDYDTVYGGVLYLAHKVNNQIISCVGSHFITHDYICSVTAGNSFYSNY